MSYRPQVEIANPRDRAALQIYSTLLGGSMASRLFDEIREQRGLAYSVYAVDHASADVPILQLSAGLDSSKCAEAFARMKEIVALHDAGRAVSSVIELLSSKGGVQAAMAYLAEAARAQPRLAA